MKAPMWAASSPGCLLRWGMERSCWGFHFQEEEEEAVVRAAGGWFYCWPKLAALLESTLV
jgi:hypothetical protein